MLINDVPRPTWGLSHTELYLALGFAAVFALAAIAYLGVAAVGERSPLPLFMLVGVRSRRCRAQRTSRSPPSAHSARSAWPC
jgi:hypothetical protein